MLGLSGGQRRDREEALERALAGRGSGDAEADRLAALAEDLKRLDASAARINERRVWLRVRAGMLAEPQRQRRGTRGLAVLSGLVALPRPMLAGGLAVALLVSMLVASVVFQPGQSASAAFLSEVEQIARVSEAAAERGALTPDESASLERRALGLLDLASRPEVISGLRGGETELAHARLREARSALAALLSEHPGDTRALAALAAISGLLEEPQPITASRGATPQQTAAPSLPAGASARATAESTAEPTPEATVAPVAVTVTATPAAERTPKPTSTPSTSGRRDDEEARRTPESGAGGNSNSGPGTAVAPSRVGALLSAMQGACARVFDSASMKACTLAASAAAEACDGARSCQATIDAAVGAAQQRVQRMGEDCQRLPDSRSRDACSVATSGTGGTTGTSGTSGTSGSGDTSGSGSGDNDDDDDERSGGDRRNEGDSRGRRD